MSGTPSTVRWERLPVGHAHLMSAVHGPHLAEHGYVESEWAATGTAQGYLPVETPGDGHWVVEPAGTAGYTTRVLLRRPADPSRFSGVAVVEWLNVSSGEDAAPDYRYLGEEIVRRGHLWIGLSAQQVGVEGGRATVAVDGVGDAEVGGGLKAHGERYAGLSHPGDRYCYGILTETARALRERDGTPWADLEVTTVLAVGESQSAYALTTYCNAVHPRERAVDGFLVHSRGGAAMSLGEPGRQIDLMQDRTGGPVRIRTDLDVPVLVVLAETDVLSPRLWYLPARQPDVGLLRTWEIAGTAHADLWQIGDFESFLGGHDPVNRGQQGYVVRAALRRLEEWVREGTPPPGAPPLEVGGGPEPAFLTDEVGNVRGGVRTPVVDAAVQVHSGMAAPDAPPLVLLFGRTLPADPAVLAARYADRSAYLAAYRAATERAIAAGFVLPEDREAVLSEARPELLPG